MDKSWIPCKAEECLNHKAFKMTGDGKVEMDSGAVQRCVMCFNFVKPDFSKEEPDLHIRDRF
jgi:hypothetical protein